MDTFVGFSSRFSDWDELGLPTNTLVIIDFTLIFSSSKMNCSKKLGLEFTEELLLLLLTEELLLLEVLMVVVEEELSIEHEEEEEEEISGFERGKED